MKWELLKQKTTLSRVADDDNWDVCTRKNSSKPFT